MPSRLRLCHKGLPMGDLNVADWCCEAHSGALQSAGSLTFEAQLANSRPVPRGGLIEALVVDDHLGIAIDPEGDSKNADEMNFMCLRCLPARWLGAE